MPRKLRLNVFPGDENLACHLHVAQLACASQVTEGLLAVTQAQQVVIELQPAIDMAKVDPELTKADLSTAVEGAARLTTTDSYVAKGHLVRDCTLKAFSLEYSGPNDGSQSELTATVQRAPDDNPITIRGGRLKFVMSSGRYKCPQGEVIQQVDSDDGSKTIVYVRVDIPRPGGDSGDFAPLTPGSPT